MLLSKISRNIPTKLLTPRIGSGFQLIDVITDKRVVDKKTQYYLVYKGDASDDGKWVNEEQVAKFLIDE